MSLFTCDFANIIQPMPRVQTDMTRACNITTSHHHHYLHTTHSTVPAEAGLKRSCGLTVHARSGSDAKWRQGTAQCQDSPRPWASSLRVSRPPTPPCIQSSRWWRSPQASMWVSQRLASSWDPYASTPPWCRRGPWGSWAEEACGNHVPPDAAPQHWSCLDTGY